MTRAVIRDAAVFPAAAYDPACRRCARLAQHLDDVRAEHPNYFCRPVPPFGDPHAALVIVGLAPGKHGANATGRPFTGDYAGILLYETLFKFGFASRPESTSAGDGLQLIAARISNAVKCLPPGNKPLPVEVSNCNPFLEAELATLPQGAALLALGRVAHDAVLRAMGEPGRKYPFAHGAEHVMQDNVRLFDCYHCSRYNTNTRRLTTAMFERVFESISRHLGRIPAAHSV